MHSIAVSVPAMQLIPARKSSVSSLATRQLLLCEADNVELSGARRFYNHTEGLQDQA